MIGRYGRWLKSNAVGLYDLELDDTAIKALDRLKQWCFYVDCVRGTFQAPDKFAGQSSQLLDFLFAMAEERADSFARFHLSAEQSALTYIQSRKHHAIGSLFPPPIRSDAELAGHILSLASQYCRSQPPNYLAFDDGCKQLSEVVTGPILHAVLKSVGQQMFHRSQCANLSTAASRGYLMMKLILHAIPSDQRKETAEEWATKRE
jgi:hypothetical protein